MFPSQVNKDHKVHLDPTVNPELLVPEDLMVRLDLLGHLESEEPTASPENKELKESVVRTVRKARQDRGERLDHLGPRDQ